MTRGGRFALAAMLVAGCSPNPRTEIGAIAEAALTQVARTSPGSSLCVERTISPWQPADEVRRIDPPAPPGFETLRTAGRFRGGGGLKGDRVGGVAVGSGPGCFDLRGPVIGGDRAMIEVHLSGSGWNKWLQRSGGGWRVVAETYSDYPI